MKRVAAICVAVILLAAGVWEFGSLALASRNAGVDPRGFPPADLLLQTPDGTLVAAQLKLAEGRGAPGVLFVHGLGADRRQTAGNAAWFGERGYSVMSIDLRGHGLSTPRPMSLGFHEGEDVRVAFEELKARTGGAPVAVVGISLGGAAALIGERGPLPADALVLIGVFSDVRHAIRSRVIALAGVFSGRAIEPFLSFQSLPRYGVLPSRLSSIEALRHRTGPTLLVGGECDAYTPPTEVEEMARAAAGPTKVWIETGLDHSDVSNLDSDDFRKRLADYLAETIGRP